MDVLVVRAPMYHSPGDETAFFGWLKRIRAVSGVQARGRDLARLMVRYERPLQIVIGLALLTLTVWLLTGNPTTASFSAAVAVLNHAGNREGKTQQELADALMVTKGNVCQVLDGMEAEARASGRARMERKLDWNAYMTELNYVIVDVRGRDAGLHDRASRVRAHPGRHVHRAAPGPHRPGDGAEQGDGIQSGRRARGPGDPRNHAAVVRSGEARVVGAHRSESRRTATRHGYGRSRRPGDAAALLSEAGHHPRLARHPEHIFNLLFLQAADE